MFARAVALSFVLLWSSSFVATKTGLRHLSPLLFVAIRLVGCAVVLVGLMVVQRRSWRPLGGWRWLHCAIAGTLVNAVGLMAPHVGLLTALSAQVALVQSLTPVLTAASGLVFLREPLGRSHWLGLALGVIGVGLVAGQAALESAPRLEGLLLAFVGVAGFVAGTVYFARFCRSVPLLPGATAQFLFAALVAVLGAGLLETPHADWAGAAVAAVAWITILVSLGGMGLYASMLLRGTAAGATVNFYLVPGVTAVLAWLLLGERLSPLAVVGLIVASIGCWFVHAAPAPKANSQAVAID
jgi:drug/metabolite transporter (DMT)-like permease